VKTPARNPFSLQDNQAPSTEGATPVGTRQVQQLEQVQRAERVEKPWGHEEVFAVLEGQYVGKILNISAGGVLSLQMHRSKVETVAVQSGRISMEYGPDADHLRTVILGPGDRLLIPARVMHRMTAVVDSLVLEASTAHAGWRDDVVRFEDRYGRAGTSAP
jgi:mannose-6-phosphate isomerase-like protein (cupin superfamily)